MSDISSFAEWEAQHQHSDEGPLNERQQQLIDMASDQRIWADRDSSNDYRSSATDSDNQSEDSGVELLVRREERKTVNAEVIKARGVGMPLDIGVSRDSEFHRSTFDPSQALSQVLEEVVSFVALLSPPGG